MARVSAGQIAKSENQRFDDGVVDGCPFAVRSHELGFAQNPQVLGGVGLFEVAGTMDFSDATRPVAKAMQDAQACGIGKGEEKNRHAV